MNFDASEGGAMSPDSSTHSRNLAARMGRWSASHWKTATFGWLAFVLVAFGLGGMVGTRNIDNTAGPGESGRMNRILDAGFKQPASEHVLIQSRSDRVGEAAFDAVIADVVARVSNVADVQDVRSPLAAAYAAQISEDRHSALVQFEIRGDKEDAADKIAPVLDAVAAAQASHQDFTIGEFGDASAEKGVVESYDEDLGKAGALSLPITLIVLILTFGSLVAAGIPLLLALTAVFATFGLVALSSLVLPVGAHVRPDLFVLSAHTVHTAVRRG
jgi:RND superfamily putative drug exporter